MSIKHFGMKRVGVYALSASMLLVGVFSSLAAGANTFPLSKPRVVTASVEHERAIRFAFLGDIMLDRGVAATLKKTPFQDLLGDFRDGAHFEDYDLVVANLEGPFAAKRIATSKSIAFRFDPVLAPELQWLGIDAVSLANNHGLDMGTKALGETRDVLKENKIWYFGDPWSVNSFSSYTVEVQRKRVALVGFNTTFYSLTQKDMVAKVKEARKDADIVLVMMHWGNEYKTKHDKVQEKLAHALIDAGADAVVGAHPHVVQDTEIYKEKPIAYSLGNFLFDQTFSKATQQGMMAIVEISADGKVGLSTRGFTSKKHKPEWDKENTP